MVDTTTIADANARREEGVQYLNNSARIREWQIPLSMLIERCFLYGTATLSARR
jgi:hypothetical protein